MPARPSAPPSAWPAAIAHLKRNNHVVAVVGDASIVNGLAFEGLNNAGTLKRNLLIVLNDNGMSISQPQGAFGQYLERIRVSTTYDEFKRVSEKLVHRLPGGMSADRSRRRGMPSATASKASCGRGRFSRAMGIKYMGPIDGHDLPGLINFLAEIKHVNRPVLLHVKTVKGNGYEIAANRADPIPQPGGIPGQWLPGGNQQIGREIWTTAFADAMIDLAKNDSRVMRPDGRHAGRHGTEQIRESPSRSLYRHGHLRKPSDRHGGRHGQSAACGPSRPSIPRSCSGPSTRSGRKWS